MPEQITNLDALAGKTIARAVAMPKSNPFAIGLIFADGSFLYLNAEERNNHELSICCDDEPTQPDERVTLGLMTPEERDRLKAELEARRVASDREHYRREYERLKAVFEPEEEQ